MRYQAERRKLFLTTTGIMVLALPLLTGVLRAPRSRAQTAPPQSTATDGRQLAFDVVSIKPNTTGGEICTSVAFSCVLDLGKPGLLTATNQSLRELMQVAYRLTPAQTRLISAGPKWVDAERFDIQATAEDNPGLEEKRMMLQSLLADRFKLALHHETRQGPLYALVLAKAGKTGSGLVQHSGAAACIDLSKGPPPHPPTVGDSFCGGFLVLGRGGLTHVTANNATMASLAEELSGGMSGGEISRAVVDRTGLSGSFDLTLEYTPSSRIDSSTTASDNAAPPSLITALQDQLGLKLESQTGPVDVLVIDHVEEPSPN